jgi:hypothetical protein
MYADVGGHGTDTGQTLQTLGLSVHPAHEFSFSAATTIAKQQKPTPLVFAKQHHQPFQHSILFDIFLNSPCRGNHLQPFLSLAAASTPLLDLLEESITWRTE